MSAGDDADADGARPADARREAAPEPFSVVERVRFGDLDAMGHLNNVEFLRFFETARIDYLATLVPDHSPTARSEFGWIFAECHIAYRAPAFFGDRLRTFIEPGELRRSSLRLDFRMVAERDRRLVADGYGVLVGYAYGRGEPDPCQTRSASGCSRGSAAGAPLVSAAVASSSYDCVVIGSGPGGYVAAIRAAQVGMKTAIVERDKLGGRCLNYACIPAKAVLRAADVFSEVKDAGSFGIKLNGEPTIDFEGTAKHRDKVVKTLTGGVGSLMKGNGIDVVEGHGAVTSSSNVRVGDDELETGSVIIATGSIPKPLLGLEFSARVLDTERAWAIRELPGKLAVVGAGASGSEIASAYGRLGTEVTLLEALPQILPLEDEEIAKAAAREIRKQNVNIVTEADVASAEVGDDGVELRYGDGQSERFEYLAIAAGRAPDIEGLGLDDAGVKTGENERIEVDERLRTSVEGVYAIGDVVHGPALAHKASDEGVIAAEAAAGLETHPLDYNSIPAATFCHPQVASFGMTEKQALEAGYDVVVGKVPMGAVGAPTVYGERTGMIKVVGDSRYGEILGAHMVGAKATDLIAELVVAHDLEGGFAEVARVVHAHPTFSEATMEAARATDGWLIHG